MKKFIIFALITLLTLSVLTACSGNHNNTANSGNNDGTESVINLYPDSDTSTSNDNNVTQPQGRVVNVTSPAFILSDRFINPIEQQTTVPDGFIGIYTAEEFDKIRLQRESKYILMANIDLTILDEWEAISSFSGILDGNGYTIKDNRHSSSVRGHSLFYSVRMGEIKNLGVDSNYTVEFSRSGSIETAGMINKAESAIIDNCYFSGSIEIIRPTGDNSSRLAVQAGGIVGVADSSIINNSYNDGNIVFNDGLNVAVYLGGIVGSSTDSRIVNCFNKGNLSAKGERNYIGGIVGEIRKDGNIVTGCYNEGVLTVDNNAGGIRIRDTSFNMSAVGGIAVLADFAEAEINNCYNAGNINVNENYGVVIATLRPNAGGIIFGSGTVNNSYNFGNITIETNGEHSLVYGIGGKTIINSYNFGELNGINNGGISGNFANIEFCYFLNNVENATPDGALFTNVKKLTAEQMKDKSSFVGFDFDDVWEMGNPDYPFPIFKSNY